MISPTAEYALRAVVAIAQANGEAAATQAIAKLTKVPAGYLPKVLQMLGRAGVVESRRGLGGGFRLAGPADELTVLEVVNAVDPIKRIERCPLDLESHGGMLCPLHKRLDEATEHVERSFANTTIAELLRGPGTSTPFCEGEVERTVGVPLGGAAVGEGATGSAARRHDALIEFSRDHTLGLAVAKHLSESAEGSDRERHDAVREFLAAWGENLAVHFAQEEQFLLPVVSDEGHAGRLRKEHAAVRACVELAEVLTHDQAIDPVWVRGFGKLLQEHIRWEERELFPTIEQSAPAEALEGVARRMAERRAAR